MVATPIGNLKDITLRAIEVLKSVDFILTEDTRVSSRLLSEHAITTHMVSYHQHSSDEKKFEILKELLQGKNLALITDAGTPGISDPGNELIDFVLTKEPTIKIVPIPGASSITTALSASGFRSDKFMFIGFFPKKGKTKIMDLIKESGTTVVFFESPHRILKTLDYLIENLESNQRILVARELTKMYETLYRGTVTEVKEKLEKENPKGEVVVVVENN